MKRLGVLLCAACLCGAFLCGCAWDGGPGAWDHHFEGRSEDKATASETASAKEPNR